MDSKDLKFQIDDNNIYKNTKYAIGYYQNDELITGVKLDFKDKEINGVNILSPGSNHRSIDNNLAPYIADDINNFLDGKDAPKEAQKRKMPTFVPKKNEAEKQYDIL